MKNKKEYMMHAIMEILGENYQVDLSTIKGIDIFESVKKDFENKCEDKEYYLEVAKDFFEIYEMNGEVDLEKMFSEPNCVIHFYGKVIVIRNQENKIMIHAGKKEEILISKVLQQSCD